MRSMLAAIVMIGLVLGMPVAGRANGPVNYSEWQAHEMALSIVATIGNVGYLPAKTIVAAGGLALGSIAAMMTLGDYRAAYAFWVPCATGTFILRPSNLDGTEPLEFFGTDYADRPSTRPNDWGVVYDAMYRPR